jgi:hypothetical protein
VAAPVSAESAAMLQTLGAPSSKSTAMAPWLTARTASRAMSSL